MDLGNAARKVIHEVIDRVVERHLGERMVGKKPGQLAADRLVHAVVVVGVQEAALPEKAPQHLEIGIAEADVAVPGHVEVGDVPEIVLREHDDLLLRGRAQRGALPDGPEQVRETGRVGVPVAPALIVQPPDRERRSRGRRRRAAGLRRGRRLRLCASGRERDGRRCDAPPQSRPAPFTPHRCAPNPSIQSPSDRRRSGPARAG